MMCYNPKLDLVNMNAYIKFGEILSICSQDEAEMKFWLNQAPLLWYKCAENPKLDLVIMNAYIKFCEILSICSQDIEQKWNSSVNQRP